MPTTLTNKKGGSVWTLQQAKSLNAMGAEVETAIDAAALVAANAQATDASFTIGTEAANAINVAVELQDSEGNAVESVQVVTVFLSDADTGLGVTATAPDGGVAVGTDGAVIAAVTAGKVLIVQTEADGTFDLTLTEAAGATWYMVVVLPNGKQAVSGAITFAA